MKTYKRQKLNLIATLTALALATPVMGEEKQENHEDHAEHAHKAMEAPNGGRILTEVEPHAELFLTEERKLQISILDEDGKVVKATDAEVTAVAGKRSSPTMMKFINEDGVLVSDKALPEGMNVPTIITFKASPDAKKQTVRLAMNLADCPTCEFLEYACTCAHGEDGHEGHDH